MIMRTADTNYILVIILDVLVFLPWCFGIFLMLEIIYYEN